MSDRVDALLWALDKGHVALPAGTVVWRAPNSEVPGDLRYVTPNRVEAEALLGVKDEPEPELPAGPLPGALVFLGRDREENLAVLGQVLSRLAAGAPLVTAGSNALGAGWYDRTLTDAALPVEVVSKNKCRVAWVARPAELPAEVVAWAALSEPVEVAPRLWTCPGIFSKGHPDPASVLLAESLPRLEGHVGDWGAGWGYLAATAFDRFGDAITRLELVDSDHRALTLAARALSARGAPFGVHWVDARERTGLKSLDVIVSNPPFHDGDRHAASVAHAFLSSAASALRGAGRAYVVGPRNLPYDEPLRATFERTRIVAQADGFRVYEASHPRRGAPPPTDARGGAVRRA